MLLIAAALLMFNNFGLLYGQAAVAARGIDAVETMQATGTVTKMDLAKRKVSIEFEDGKHKTIKVDKSVKNLEQVQVGDKVKLDYVEEMIITVGQSSEPVGAAVSALIATAPKGDKPGGVMMDTTSSTVKIVSVDPEKRHVTVLDTDGKERKIKIHKNAKGLDELKPGETVNVTVTEAVAIDVEK